MARAMRGRTALALIAAALLAGTISSANAAPTLDTTVPVPAVTITDVTRARPQHGARDDERRHAQPRQHAATCATATVRCSSQRTPEIQINTGLKPNEVIVDLLDLQPGSSYNLRRFSARRSGPVISSSVPFARRRPCS